MQKEPRLGVLSLSSARRVELCVELGNFLNDLGPFTDLVNLVGLWEGGSMASKIRDAQSGVVVGRDWRVRASRR